MKGGPQNHPIRDCILDLLGFSAIPCAFEPPRASIFTCGAAPGPHLDGSDRNVDVPFAHAVALSLLSGCMELLLVVGRTKPLVDTGLEPCQISTNAIRRCKRCTLVWRPKVGAAWRNACTLRVLLPTSCAPTAFGEHMLVSPWCGRSWCVCDVIVFPRTPGAINDANSYTSRRFPSFQIGIHSAPLVAEARCIPCPTWRRRCVAL